MFLHMPRHYVPEGQTNRNLRGIDFPNALRFSSVHEHCWAGPPDPPPPGDHRGDPGGRHRTDGDRGRRGAQPVRGGPAARHAAAVAVPVLPVQDGDLRRALPARRRARSWPRTGAVATATERRDDPLERLCVNAFCRWCLQHPVYSQLLFWRTIPGFEPSPEAFAPAQESIEELRNHLQAAVDAGRLHPDATSDEGNRALHVDDRRRALAADRQPAGRVVRGRTVQPAAARRTRDVLPAIRTDQGVDDDRSTRGADRPRRPATVPGPPGRGDPGVARPAGVDRGDRVATPYGLRRVGRRGHRRAPDRPGGGRDPAVVVPAPVPQGRSGSTPASRGSTRT